MSQQKFTIEFEHPDAFEALRQLTWALLSIDTQSVRIIHDKFPVELSCTLDTSKVTLQDLEKRNG